MSLSETAMWFREATTPAAYRSKFLPCPKSSATVAKRLGTPEQGSQSPCRLCWFLLYP